MNKIVELNRKEITVVSGGGVGKMLLELIGVVFVIGAGAYAILGFLPVQKRKKTE